jgi:hypothetical protein
MTPIEHVQKICAWFVQHAITKYMAGQEEHGGRLWRKPVWRYLRDEIIDMPIYFQVLEEQQTRVEVLLGDALKGFVVEDHPSYDSVQKAYNLIVYGNEDGIAEEEK